MTYTLCDPTLRSFDNGWDINEPSHAGTASCLQIAIIPDYFLVEFVNIKSILSGG